jgi:hypothetical protein
MAGKVTKVTVGNQELPAREVAFEAIAEPWAEYKLLDGGRIRLRTTVLTIYRVLKDDGTPAYQPDGQPFFVITGAPQMAASD